MKASHHNYTFISAQHGHNLGYYLPKIVLTKDIKTLLSNYPKKKLKVVGNGS